MQEGKENLAAHPKNFSPFVHLHSSALTDAEFSNFSRGTQDFFFFNICSHTLQELWTDFLCVESEEFPFAWLSAFWI